MNPQQPIWWQRFLWRTAGALIFVAAVIKPVAAEYASASSALHAWLIRLGWAAGWAFLAPIISPSFRNEGFLRITPAPEAPNETATQVNAAVEQKSRVDVRMVLGFALVACIETLLTGKESLTAPLGSPQSIAAWVDVLIYTALWGMLGGAFSAKPRRIDDSSTVEQLKEHPPAWLEQKPEPKKIDRARWIMFAMFFGVALAVSVWAHGGDLRLGRTWTGALEYCGKLLAMSVGLAFFWAPIPAMFSSGDPDLIRITPARPEPPSPIS